MVLAVAPKEKVLYVVFYSDVHNVQPAIEQFLHDLAKDAPRHTVWEHLLDDANPAFIRLYPLRKFEEEAFPRIITTYKDRVEQHFKDQLREKSPMIVRQLVVLETPRTEVNHRRHERELTLINAPQIPLRSTPTQNN